MDNKERGKQVKAIDRGKEANIKAGEENRCKLTGQMEKQRRARRCRVRMNQDFSQQKLGQEIKEASVKSFLKQKKNQVEISSAAARAAMSECL